MSAHGTLLVGTWTLSPSSATPSQISARLPSDHEGEKGESTFEPDLRKLVSPADYGPGGKYRSIVKLQMRYERQEPDDHRVCQGTGWLIRPDLMVTAGHNVFNWNHKFGRCTEMKAYIGYNGKDSVKSPNVQFRKGKNIATTEGWLSAPEHRAYDVAFVQFDEPFTNVAPFKFAATPATGSESLGVVGYPGDMRMNGESGAQMYEEFAHVNYDLAKSDLHMLEYRINSFGGQSGSPVLRADCVTSVGAHVYGGGDKNKASTILGQHGNQYWSYISVFDKQYPVATVQGGISFLQADGMAGAPGINQTPKIVGGSSGYLAPGTNQAQKRIAAPNGYSTPGQSIGYNYNQMGPVNEEGIFQILKTVAKVGGPIASNILKIGSPFLGPIGGPAAALAGTVVKLASGMAESAMTEGPESVLTTNLAAPSAASDHASRAILCEAALQTVLQMDKDQVEELHLVDTMKNVYNKVSPMVAKVAPRILEVIKEPALRIALEKLNNLEHGRPVHLPQQSQRQPLRFNQSESSLTGDPQTDAFKESLLTPTYPVEGEEGFLDDFANIAHKGLSTVAPIFGKAFTGLLGSLAESEFEPTPSEQDLGTVFQRHVAGEAALQALMNVNPNTLQEEGLFDVFKDVAQRVGGVVMKTAPGLIKSAIPIVTGLIRQQLTPGAEASFGSNTLRPAPFANSHHVHHSGVQPSHSPNFQPYHHHHHHHHANQHHGFSSGPASSFSNTGFRPLTSAGVQSNSFQQTRFSQGGFQQTDYCPQCNNHIQVSSSKPTPGLAVRPKAPRLRSAQSFGDMLAASQRLAQSDRLFRGMFEEGEVADVRFPQFAALAAGRRQSDDNEDLGPFVDGGEVGWEMES